ncbi:MAG: GNAT family protein [Nocardioides sp.]|uniref:GNAT family N-acetyltransferase n=1 Tax=Nocardioides sp. TaxID=35761 RepID=UPI0039E3FFF6
MTAIDDLLPVLGLRITAGPLELRGLCDEDLAALADLAVAGIHAPEEMPFYVPWTDVPIEELPRNLAQYHWRSRADFSPAAWDLHLGVWHDGELVGTQGFSTREFLVTRTGETGSWIGRSRQGRGIGTAMRQVICALAFDHLDAAEVTSAAFVDNPASIAVSRKVGYRDNGIVRLRRRPGEMAENIRLVLTPESFIRGEHELQVEGLGAFRRAIGLPD